MIKIDEEFKIMVNDILSNPKFKELNNMKHHGGCNTTYQHCIKTAYFAYNFCHFCNLNHEDTERITRATLLHDFYDKNWRYKKHRPFFKKHVFKHGEEAAKNATLFFNITEKQKDAIVHHMFPLTKWPKYKDGWIVTFSDKVISTQEMCNACIYFFSTPKHKIKMAESSKKIKTYRKDK